MQKQHRLRGVGLILGIVAIMGLSWLSCSAPETNTENQQEGVANTDAGNPETPQDNTTPPAQLREGPLVDYVNPFIGTGGTGFGVGSSYPGAAAPFGMVKISPDTGSKERGLAFALCAGYAYSNTEIVGFSHIHVHGTGVPDYGNLLFMPVTGDITQERVQEKGYRSPFTHDNEEAKPGYYSVMLDRWKVKAELTATVRTAHHRYTYPTGTAKRQVLIRLDHALPSGDVSDAEFTIKSDTELEGWLHSKGGLSKRHDGFKLYFVIRSKTPFKAGTWNDKKLFPEETQQKGAKIGAWLTFPQGKEPVELQTGISFVSIEGARKNLKAEQKGWDFDGTRKATRDEWEKQLSVVKVAGGTEKQLRIFYTALYHVLQMPTILMDVDGSYRGLDEKVRKADGFVYYSDFSLWDTYRTQHPLLVLLYPKIQRDMVKSLLAMARDGGELPRWPIATGYSSTMVGASADIVIADTYIKGIKDFNVEEAYKAMKRQAMGPTPPGSLYGGRGHITEYMKHGFIPADKRSGSASVTMEYAYNDYAIAQLAKALGKTEDYEQFMKRSTYYKNIWDPKTKFFRGKNLDGTWQAGFDPLKWTKDYVEGTAWQYLFFVPHDVEGLNKLFGGKEETLKKLTEFFEKAEIEQRQTDPVNLRSYYWHSNEPDLHAPSLFQLLGRGDLTQRWTRWAMKTQYKDAPDGIAGNDDAGTLSAWYVFNALGIYPIPSQDVYILSSPIFERAVVTLKDTSFEVRADNASDKAIYVDSVKLQDKPVTTGTITHTDLVKKGTLLHFKMKEKP